MTNVGDDRSERGVNLGWALEVWKRRQWVGVIAFAAAFAGAVSLAVSLPDLYRATATVLVEAQQVSEAFVQPSVTSELGTRIQRIRQEVMSRARVEVLITQLNLYPDLRNDGVPFDAVVERMRRDVGLELTGVDPQMSGRGPTIAFAISYSGRDPDTVAQVANTLAGVYVEENTRMRAGQASKTAEFLRAQLADVKKELDEQERRTSDFKLQHLGELPQQVEANLGSLERLNTQLRLNSESQIRAMDRRDRLEAEQAAAQSAAPDAAAPGSPRAGPLEKLRQELADLRRQFSDAYPDVVRVKAEIAALERQDPDPTEPATPAAPRVDARQRLTQAYAEVQAGIRMLKEEELRLRQAILTYERRVENVPKRQEEFQTVSRDHLTTKERYDTLLKRYEDAQLAERLEREQQTEQFRIQDAAIPPRRPAAPRRLRLMAVGLIFSLMFAAGAVLASEKLDTSFHSIEDLRGFVKGPVLFSIPVIRTTIETRRYWRRVALTAIAVIAGLALIVAGVRYAATGNERIVRLVARGQV